MRSSLRALGAGLALLGIASAATAGAYLSKQEALELAFPEADRLDTRNVVVSDAQARAIEGLAHAPLDSRIATIHTAFAGERLLGYAFIDVHTVRTLPEAFLVVITPEGEVRSLRVLAFYEPEEYRPPERWLAQFESQPLREELRLEGRIHGIAGATLSARAVTAGVRRSLALFQVLVKGETPLAGAAPETASGGGR